MEKARPPPDVTFVENRMTSLKAATRWSSPPSGMSSRSSDLERARKLLTHPILFDGRNLFDPGRRWSAWASSIRVLAA